jgi:hypothetical protein
MPSAGGRRIQLHLYIVNPAFKENIMKYTKHPLVIGLTTCLAGGMLLASQALANELVNPGAETGDLTGWIADEVVSVSLGTDVFEPRSGEWLFLMADGLIIDDPELDVATVSMRQTVDLGECSNEHIRGTFTASGHVATDGDHWGTFALDFGAGAVVVLDSLQSDEAGEWTEFGPISGPIPEADSVDFIVSGSRELLDSLTDLDVLVAYDDLSLSFNCIEGYAKVGGRIGQHGNGNAPEFAFSGAVGTLADGSMANSSISINYRALKSHCDFEVGSDIVFTSETSATIDAEYTCRGGEKDEQTGTAVIDVTAKDASGCVAHASKDRGSISVIADDAELDITGGAAGETGAEVCIEMGNVEVHADADDNGDNGDNGNGNGNGNGPFGPDGQPNAGHDDLTPAV